MLLRTRVLWGFVLMAVLVAAVAIFSQFMSRRIMTNLSSITSNLVPGVSKVVAINVAVLGLAESATTTWYLRKSLYSANASDIDRELREYAEAKAELTELKNWYADFIDTDPEEYPHGTELILLSDRLMAEAEKLFILSEQPGQEEKGLAVISDVEQLVARISTLTALARRIELANLEERDLASKTEIGRTIRLTSLAMLGGVIVACLLGLGLVLQIVGPVLRLRAATESVGRGELDTTVTVESQDELGDLAEAFNAMVRSLRETTVSKDFLDNIIRSMLDVLLVVDEQGVIRLANSAAASLLGTTEGHLVGRPVAEFLPQFGSLAPDGTVSPEHTGGARTVLRAESGEEIPVSAGFSRIGDNAVSGTVVVARDVRAKEQTEAEMRRYREQLAHSQQLASMGTVAALLAHKLNQPLTVVHLLLQQLLRKAADPEVFRAKIKECLSEVQLVSSTVKEVLRYTRPPSREANEQVRLSRVAERIRFALSENAREANLTIDASSLDALEDFAGVESEWEEIFFILIENAIQAVSPEQNAKLTISGSVHDDVLSIAFEDTCCGIAPEHLDKIFELFFSTKPRFKGTGLGLGIAHQLISARGGEIKVWSELGKGSRFLLTMPLGGHEDL